eukprot:14804148-Alexandrium_andersonii.AAC.1
MCLGTATSGAAKRHPKTQCWSALISSTAPAGRRLRGGLKEPLWRGSALAHRASQPQWIGHRTDLTRLALP